jgi:drug/metabolite transporter (DMT)-like permease
LRGGRKPGSSTGPRSRWPSRSWDSTSAWRQEARQLNWTALALAVAIVGLDLGFLFLYRGGYAVSLGALVTQSAAALLLLCIGVAVFRERLSLANAVGLVLCIAGLWLVNRR